MIPADKHCLEIAGRYGDLVEIEEAGNMVLVKTKSRSMAERVARALYSRNCIKIA